MRMTRGIGAAALMVVALGIMRRRDHTARKRIGEMRVMLLMLDAVHQPKVGLRGQHGRHCHANHGNRIFKPRRVPTRQACKAPEASKEENITFSDRNNDRSRKEGRQRAFPLELGYNENYERFLKIREYPMPEATTQNF